MSSIIRMHNLKLTVDIAGFVQCDALIADLKESLNVNKMQNSIHLQAGVKIENVTVSAEETSVGVHVVITGASCYDNLTTLKTLLQSAVVSAVESERMSYLNEFEKTVHSVSAVDTLMQTEDTKPAQPALKEEPKERGAYEMLGCSGCLIWLLIIIGLSIVLTAINTAIGEDALLKSEAFVIFWFCGLGGITAYLELRFLWRAFKYYVLKRRW